MRRLALLGALLLLVPATPAWAGPGLSISDVHAAGGQLTFTVTAPAGTALSGVAVNLGGTAVPATVRAAAAVSPSPVADGSVVLIVDTSGSMAGARLAGAKAAADGYADALPPAVRLGLVAVSDRPSGLVAPTADRAAFHRAVAGLRAGGGTALYDGVRVAAGLLDGPGQRRIVVLTDGSDTASSANPAQAAASAAAAGAGVDVIGYGPDAGSAAVHDLATRSGGRVVAAADAQALRGAFASITVVAPPPASASVTVTVPTWLAGTDSTLTVALPGGPPATATVPVPGGPGPAAVRVAPTVGWPLTVALAAVAAAGLLAGAVVVYLTVGRSRVRGRLRQLERFGRVPGAQRPGQLGRVPGAQRPGQLGRVPGAQRPGQLGRAVPDTDARASVLRTALDGAERVVARRGNLERVEADLDRAGMNLRAGEWLMVRLGTALLGGFLLAALLPWLVGLLLGAAAGWFGTGGYRRLRATRRVRRFADHLPDALQLVVSALRSGFSFPQAVAALAHEGDEAVAGEFGRALAETRVGGELEDALLRVAERMDSSDLAWLVMAIRVQREVGGALSEVLQTAVETMRERARLRRHVRALSAEGRLSAWVLAGMPIALAGFMVLFRREYLRPLYTTPLGIAMLAGSVLMMAFGTFWLTRMIKVEV